MYLVPMAAPLCRRARHCGESSAPGLLVVERDRIELEPVLDEPVAEPARDLGLQALDLLRLKLDHLAGAQVDQVVVIGFRHLLVARAALGDIMAMDHACVLETLS